MWRRKYHLFRPEQTDLEKYKNLDIVIGIDN